ncbi:PPC domain-containing protein, partial [Stigmatella aurantiaca]
MRAMGRMGSGWWLPVAVLSACGGMPEGELREEAVYQHRQALVSPPPAPSGSLVQYAQPVAVGGSVSAAAGLTPGYAGYTFQVAAGTQLKLEVTHLGSSMYLDTGLFLYGPKDAQGAYGPTVLFQDDDSGYGELSKVGLATLTQAGEYLAVVGWGNAAGMHYRLQVDCVGG